MAFHRILVFIESVLIVMTIMHSFFYAETHYHRKSCIKVVVGIVAHCALINDAINFC